MSIGLITGGLLADDCRAVIDCPCKTHRDDVIPKHVALSTATEHRQYAATVILNKYEHASRYSASRDAYWSVAQGDHERPQPPPVGRATYTKRTRRSLRVRRSARCTRRSRSSSWTRTAARARDITSTRAASSRAPPRGICVLSRHSRSTCAVCRTRLCRGQMCKTWGTGLRGMSRACAVRVRALGGASRGRV